MIRHAGAAVQNTYWRFESTHLGYICPCPRHFSTNTRPSFRSTWDQPEGRVSRYDRRPPAAGSSLSKSPSESRENAGIHSYPRRKDARHSTGTQPLTSWRVKNEEEDDQPRLPRYLRREAAVTAATVAASASNSKPPAKRTGIEKASSSRISSRNSIYRSRHYDPSQVREADWEKRLLEPHILSARLKKLCEAGQVDSAVAYLKNAPLDAQNTPVWNTLIWECMKAQRFKLAYQLFVDMKRRGFSASTRTFQTMFFGLSRIEHWSTHPKQLANARSIYESFRRHLHAVRKDDPGSPELFVDPLAAYIKILGDAGQYQEIFDVYYALDSEGLLSANQAIFTGMFQALSLRNTLASASDRRQSPQTQNASDAKLLWTQMLKASERSPGFVVDSFIVSAAITALSRGRAADQTLAFQILRDYLGLTQPGEAPVTGTIPLVTQSLAAALMLCNNSQKYSLCVHFFQQVVDRPERVGALSIIDRAHVEHVLKAYISLASRDSAHNALKTLEWMLRQEIMGRNGSRIRPAISTYNLVLMACWCGADWNSAMRAFELMTGYHAHDFKDGVVTSTPRLDKRSAGRNLVPDAETMSFMVRAALASRDCANMRQCLRIVDCLDTDRLFSKQEADSNKAAKYRAFYHLKLATAVIATIDHVLTKSWRKGTPSDNQPIQWRELRFRAVEELKRTKVSQRTTGPEFIPTLEEPQRDKHERATRRM